MGPQVVILATRSPRWTAGLGRALREHGLQVRRVGRAEDSLRALPEAPGSAVVLELETAAPSWPGAVELIDRLKRADSGCLVVVIAPSGSEAVEVPAREAGAAHVCLADSADEPIVEIIQRHLGRATLQH
jgi:ActR/RegA family two-component response regulator